MIDIFQQGITTIDAQGHESLLHIVGDQKFMACVIGALMEGLGLALVFLSGGSTGGIDIIASSINKYWNISLGRLMFCIDLAIIGSSYLIFRNLETMVVGYLTMVMSMFFLDYVTNGLRQSVQFIIVSDKYEEIATQVNKKMERGVTVLYGEGFYSKEKRQVLLILAKKFESRALFTLIRQIDPRAFVSMGNVEGVFGEGFDKIKTNNAHKLEEVRQILGDGFLVKGLAEIGCHEDIPESADTLEGNALQKVRYVHDHYGVDCFADDTGLEVTALEGAPGVFTARFGAMNGYGESHDADANIQCLLDKMEEAEDRTARFRTVVALVQNGEEHLFEGIVEGKILTQKVGEGGFGYDPVFAPSEGKGLAFAQMSAENKNAISHRGRAISKLVEFLKSN